MNKARDTTYLVPDANVAFLPLVPSVEICALGDMVAEELEHVFAFLVTQPFKVSDTLGVDVERFVASSLHQSDMLVKKQPSFSGCTLMGKLTGCSYTTGWIDSTSFLRFAPPTLAALAAMTLDEWTALRPQTNCFMGGLKRS